jgi:hypothetical protein
MTAGFVLASRDPGSTFRIRWDGDERWVVVLVGPGLRARRRVYAYCPHGDFRHVFDEMASQWRGWPGEKRWSSLEGEIRLACTHDGLGHIEIRIDLETEPRAPSNWRAMGTILVEAGQLDRLARMAARFLEDRDPTPTGL